jgi:scyllo-inositol 2-dehydrogenase (NADP+)
MNKIVIVGLGNQGNKRKVILNSKLESTVDPLNKLADLKDIKFLDLKKFDSVFICTPDEVKINHILYFLSNGKNVLVEKPLYLSSFNYQKILNLVQSTGSKIYVAFNHRFEPSLIEARNLLLEGIFGNIYGIEILYSNGTARIVRDSKWRDDGFGVTPDLLSHVINLMQFWFKNTNIKILNSRFWNLENNSTDRAIVDFEVNHDDNLIPVRSEVNLVSWKNEFRCKIYGSKSNLILTDFCKWGESKLEVHTRKLPSGTPKIQIKKWYSPDPTWQAEEEYFLNMTTNDSIRNLEEAYSNSKIIEEIVGSSGG